MQSKDFDWFVEHYDQLCSEYGNKYLLIKNETVLGAYDSFADGVHAGLLTEEPGSFIVQECNTDYRAYNNYIASIFF